MKYVDITSPDINNGLGCRVTLWISGCPHHCPGCHNKETWDYEYGKEFDNNAVIDLYDKLSKPYIKGLTLSGGDPLGRQNRDELITIRFLVEAIKDKFPEKDIWIYSGDTYENLIKDEEKRRILNLCDVLIDGPYIRKLRDITLPFRGSKNQRIIDLHNTSNSKVKLLNIE